MKKLSLLLIIIMIGCGQYPRSIHKIELEEEKKETPINLAKVQVGLDILLEERKELIANKTIGLVTNQTGVDHNGIPNYERIMALDNVDLKVIFSPEHGLFGKAAAGEKVNYNGEIKTLPEVVSLYGKNRKPTSGQLAGLDIIIYDIQDIGARFYTYISTLGLVMGAAAEAGIQVIILDRPNPITGNHVEGPILDLKHKSFVGYYPIPIRYSLTVGELAQMIIGEKWIESIPELTVVPIRNWQRSQWMDETDLPWVKPSPNIPDLVTAIIYPGMCLLEATNVNEGRGTQKPFKLFGAPWINKQRLAISLNNLALPGVVFKPVSYIPTDIPGMANNPKFKNQVCYGLEVIVTDRNQFNSVDTGTMILSTLFNQYPNQFEIKTSGINRLWGRQGLSSKLKSGNNTFSKMDVETFKNESKKYHLYD